MIKKCLVCGADVEVPKDMEPYMKLFEKTPFVCFKPECMAKRMRKQ
jgi:hypothetical protein